MTAETDTLAKLRDCLAHLEDYVTRRATQLATPLIEVAQADADALVKRAEFEAQRQIDLARELGRRLRALDRQTAQAEDARRALAAVLGYQEPSALPLAALVAEVETRLAEKNAMIERLRADRPDVRLPRDPGQTVKTLVSIYGERQIETFEAMCFATGRRPHELAADILLDAIRAAQHDHETQELVEARKER